MDAKEITDALATVKDSYFNKDIITLGYVKGMTISSDTLRFSLRLPAPLMPNLSLIHISEPTRPY